MHELHDAKRIAELTIILEGIRDHLSVIVAAKQASLKRRDQLIERIEQLSARRWFPDSPQPARAKRRTKQR
jgi:hypothetical protein